MSRSLDTVVVERLARLERAMAKFAEGVANDVRIDRTTRRLGRELLETLQVTEEDVRRDET